MASISMLSLQSEDMDELAAEMSEIIAFARAAAETEITPCGEEPLPSASELRRDEVISSLPAELVLKNASEQSGWFFLARGKGLTK